MFLEQDVTLKTFAESGNVLELALSHGRFYDLAATRIFEYFDSVEPVFNAVALYQNA